MKMRPLPLVYVVLVNWNGWQDTAACLRSLAVQAYANARVVVIDNGSTDDSAARLREEFSSVSLIPTGRNLGFSGGCNVGIREALDHSADYVWLLNNDAVADPQALTALVNVAESDDRIGAVGSVLYCMDEPSRVQVWGGGWVSFWTGRSGHHRSPVAQNRLHYIIGASMLLRRAALEDVGLLDEQRYFMYWEDTDLCFRLRRRGWRLAVAEQSTVLHKQLASIGGDSPALAFYGARSSSRFFARHSRVPAWSVSVGIAGRLLKRLLRRDRRQFLAVIKGTFRQDTSRVEREPSRRLAG